MDSKADLTGWIEYGNLPSARFWLMRNKRTRHARYLDRWSGKWVGPEQENVAPAVAWALSVGLERVGT